MSKITYLCAALVTVAFSACGKTQLHSVSGTVTYKGAPAAGATVCFQRHADVSEHIIMATVQEDGSFELTCGSLGKGAPLGEYDVLIVWKAPCKQGECGCGRRADKLHGRYADPKRPRFQVVIKPEQNELAPFNLTE
jgi:hypothetical protein